MSANKEGGEKQSGPKLEDIAKVSCVPLWCTLESNGNLLAHQGLKVCVLRVAARSNITHCL